MPKTVIRDETRGTLIPGVAVFSIFGAQQMLAALIVPLAVVSNVDDRELAIIMSCSSLSFILGSALWGWLDSRLSIVWLIRIGSSGAVVGLIAFGIGMELLIRDMVDHSSGYVMILVGRGIIFGVFASAIPIAAQFLAVSNESEVGRTKAVAGIGMGYTMASFVGPAIGSVLFSITHVLPLWVAPIMVSFVTLFIIRRLPKNLGTNNYDSLQISKSTNNNEHLRLAIPWGLLGVGFLLWLSSTSTVILLPFVIRDGTKTLPVDVAQTLGIVLPLGAIVAFLTQTLVTRKWKADPAYLLITGLAPMALGVLWIGVFAGYTIAPFGFILMSAGGAMAMPGYTLWVTSKVAKNVQRRVAAVMEISNSLTGVVAPIIAVVGWKQAESAVIFIISAFLVITAIVTFHLNRKVRNRGG